jgi:hypothetical protein
MRFGVYFYAEPKNAAALPAVDGGAAEPDKDTP